MNKETEHVEPQHWSLDKRVPVSIVFVLVLQLLMGAYGYGTLSQRVTHIEDTQILLESKDEQQTELNQKILERLFRVEFLLEKIAESLEDHTDLNSKSH